METKVTVVVPVYNPGEDIRRGVDSLLSQTMPGGELEVVFVDDGSTDETPALLDRLADEHAHIRVIHQQNSGWPGQPRNVGMDAAAGTYVMFMDSDDALGVEAMQRMYDIGSRNRADIVIGKVTSDFRAVPHLVWRNTIEKCTIRDHMLIHSLTPHKMFRREFLVDTGIRYPEGKVRLEDELFVVKTYLRAQCVSVLGDYPCYFYLKRAHGRHIATFPTDPRDYFGNVREILDLINTTVEPGPHRDYLMRRFYRGEMLAKVKGGPLAPAADEFRKSAFTEIRRLALECFPDTVPDGMDVPERIRATLVREGRLDDLTDFVVRMSEISAIASVDNVAWRDGVLHADIAAHLVMADGTPLELVPRNGRYVLDPRLVAGVVANDIVDVTEDIGKATVEAVVRHRASGVEWFLPAEVEALTPATAKAPTPIGVRAHISIDPLIAAGGAPLERGVWSVAVRVRGCGLVRGSQLVPINAVAAGEAKAGLLGSPAMTVVPRFRELPPHSLLDIDESRWSFGRAMHKTVHQRLDVDRDGVLTAVLPAVTRPGTAAVPIIVDLRVSRDAAPLAVVDGWLQSDGNDVVLRVQLPPLSAIKRPDNLTKLLVMWRLASSGQAPVPLSHISWSRRRFTPWRPRTPWRKRVLRRLAS